MRLQSLGGNKSEESYGSEYLMDLPDGSIVHIWRMLWERGKKVLELLQSMFHIIWHGELNFVVAVTSFQINTDIFLDFLSTVIVYFWRSACRKYSASISEEY